MKSSPKAVLPPASSALGSGRRAVPDGYRALPTANDKAGRSPSPEAQTGHLCKAAGARANVCHQTPRKPPGTRHTHPEPKNNRTAKPALLLSSPALTSASYDGQINYPWALIILGCTPRFRRGCWGHPAYVSVLGFICISVCERVE